MMMQKMTWLAWPRFQASSEQALSPLMPWMISWAGLVTLTQMNCYHPQGTLLAVPCEVWLGTRNWNLAEVVAEVKVLYDVEGVKGCNDEVVKPMRLFYDVEVGDSCLLENVSYVSLVECAPLVEHSFVVEGKAQVWVYEVATCDEVVIAS